MAYSTFNSAAELHWLTATILMTAAFWIPYVVNRMVEHGLWAALKNPDPEKAPRAAWAARMAAAHTNAVENLVLFAPLVVISVLVQGSTPTTVIAATAYFIARAAHFVIYAIGLPLLRTVAFAAGWAACIVIGFSILGVI